KVVVLTDVFEEFLFRIPAKEKAPGPCGGVGARIVDRYLILDGLGIGACEALDHVELIGMRHAQPVEPEVFVEAPRIDNQRVSLPLADRMPVIGGHKIRGMLSS